MDIQVPLTKGLLADKYAKYAAAADIVDGKPIVSFPIKINGVPEEAKSLALTFWIGMPYQSVAFHGSIGSLPISHQPSLKSRKTTVKR